MLNPCLFQVSGTPAGNTPVGGQGEVSMDDRQKKHVSFDASSLMRSQTIATMDEATYQRTLAQGAHGSYDLRVHSNC